MRNVKKLMLSACLCGAAVLTSFNTALATPQEAAFLRTVAEQYILAYFDTTDPSFKIEVEAAELDGRRDYGGKCENYLTAELKGGEIRSSSQVRITCSKPGNKYSLILPVKVRKLNRALVASRNLTRGTQIKPSDLNQIYIDESSNLTTAVSDPDILVGSKLKRNVKEGEQIRANSFCVVCKSDKVSIVAQSGTLQLKTAGIAMEEGNINENIRVKNLKSGKIVSAIVSGPSTVRVVF